jgi:hypothetical protein
VAASRHGRRGACVTYLTVEEAVLCVLSVAGDVAVAAARGRAVFAVAGRHFVWVGRSSALAIDRAGGQACEIGCLGAALGGCKVQECSWGVSACKGRVSCLVCRGERVFVRQEPVVALLV